MTKENLECTIRNAQEAYYNGEPIMSDAMFDKLWDDLKRQYPDSELLNMIGKDSADGFEKADHVMMMGSQNKANSAAEMDKFFKKGKEYIASYKLDGISLELQYKNGTLVKAVTRGDGYKGDDITANAVKMQRVPLTLQDTTFSGAIRGEILLLREDKDKYYPEAANCRNQASGLAKRKDGDGCEHLTVMCYDMKSSDESRQWHTETLICKWLESNGFLVAPYTEAKKWTGEDAVNYIHDVFEQPRLFDIDGIVFKQNEIDWNDKSENYRPNTQIALKPARNSAVSTVTGFKWSMTNGTLTPVVQISPVELDGCTVKQANCYNAKQLADLKIELGNEVEIVRTGMIIPKVVKNVTYNIRVANY